MTQNGKRMHPMMMAASYFKLLKSSFFIFILLFVINFSSEAWWVRIGKVLFIAVLIIGFFAVIIEWWRTKYSINSESIELDEGALFRKHRSIPFQRVQNVQSATPFYLRPFKLTSLTLETGAKNDDASVTFEALKTKEAERIERTLDHYKNSGAPVENTEEEQFTGDDVDSEERLETVQPDSKPTIHFNPSRKDILKASVLSFSYLLLVPIMISIFNNIDEVYDLSSKAEKVFDFIIGSWILITLGILLFILITVIFGLTRTYLKYGRYEISSDDERIYIKSGILNERHFSIRKKNVQAVQIQQSLIKRILKLAEVKLVSAGGVKETEQEVNSLYPFLPVTRAYSIISELLPGFEVKTDMEQLPRKSLIARLCRIPWVWLIATTLLIIFKPEAAWYVSPAIFVFTYVARVLDYYFTRFLVHDAFIQFKTGSFNTTLFMTTREKVIEFELTQSFITKRFDLATFTTTNRAKPVKVQALRDVPIEMAGEAFNWYTGRDPEMNDGDLVENE